MTTSPLVEHDERTVAVGNAGYRWACVFLMYALLIDVICRGIVRQEAAWDLMALVIVAGGICQIHLARHKALPDGWAKTAVLVACVGGVIAALTAVAINVWFGS